MIRDAWRQNRGVKVEITYGDGEQLTSETQGTESPLITTSSLDMHQETIEFKPIVRLE